jgi:hypothetical protein
MSCWNMLNDLWFNIVGQDATEAFYGLHRHEILMKPQYRRLQIGVLIGEKSVIHGRIAGELSKVPYAEPTWLTDGYHSPYYTEVACSLYFLLALSTDCPLSEP